MTRRQIGAAISHASAVAASLRCMNYSAGRTLLVDGSNRGETRRGDTLHRASGFSENATLVLALRNHERGRCSRSVAQF